MKTLLLFLTELFLGSTEQENTVDENELVLKPTFDEEGYEWRTKSSTNY